MFRKKGLFVAWFLWLFLSASYLFANNIDLILGIKNSFTWRLEFDGAQVISSGSMYYTTLSGIDLYVWANTWNVSYQVTWDFSPATFSWSGAWNYTNIHVVNLWSTGTKYIYIKFIRNRDTWTYFEETAWTRITVVYYTPVVVSTGTTVVNPLTATGSSRNLLESIYDRCPGWDMSPSYYDGRCGDEDGHDTVPWDSSITDPNIPYQLELESAYKYAYRLWITSAWSLSDAALDRMIKRREMAKMISIFATKIMWKKPNYNKTWCDIFNDVKWETAEMTWFMKLSCQLNIMWIKADEKPLISFFPDMYVDRAQFGTIVSRLLFGWIYNQAWPDRYKKHLNILNQDWIIKNINVPNIKELRWFVLIMLKRVDDKFYLQDYLNNVAK